MAGLRDNAGIRRIHLPIKLSQRDVGFPERCEIVFSVTPFALAHWAFLAIHLQNLLFLLFFAIVFFFQLLTKAATKANKDSNQPESGDSDPPAPRLPREQPETDEERVRKFLEALGQPPGAAPPPPVKLRPAVQKPIVPPRSPFRTLPPLTTTPPPLPRRAVLPKQSSPRERKVFAPKDPAPVFNVYETPVPTAAAESSAGSALATSSFAVIKPSDKFDLTAVLKSNVGLREAIVLREIFGPPRAFGD